VQPPSAILASGGLDPAVVGAACGIVDVDGVPIRLAPRLMQRLWVGPVWAMAMPWAIYVHPSRASDPRLARIVFHELVHVRQWRQLGVVRFLARYGFDYFRARLTGASHSCAYRSIRYEIEARTIAGV
jgi:hypothetical protein